MITKHFKSYLNRDIKNKNLSKNIKVSYLIDLFYGLVCHKN